MGNGMMRVVNSNICLGHVDKRFDREPRGGEVEETYE